MDIMSYLLGKKKGSAKGLKVIVVEELPTTGEEDILYLVPKTGTTGDVFDEYIYVNNNYEQIGTTDIDLSNYLAKDNTTAYTPSGDYNPATKKYVDDLVGNINTVLATLTTPSNGGNA